MNRTSHRIATCVTLALAAPLWAQEPPAPDPTSQGQAESLERLRRDQDEILRKAERLHALMLRLQQRYQREGKAEEQKLLADGISHLEQAGLLREVASIRDDLAATALAEAVRKQRAVVDQLERLLNILLERNTVENLDEKMAEAARQAASAAELERRQRDLQQAAAAAMQREPSPAAKALQEQLQALQQAEAAEAQRNATEAGTRRPFLENALERVRALLEQQARLEQALADEAAGKTAAHKATQFDLGNLQQRARDLGAQVRAQGKQQDLQQAADALAKAAAGTDPQALQRARDRFEELTSNPPKLPGGSEGPTRDAAWDELRQQLQQAPTGDGPAERSEAGKLAEAGKALASQRDQQAGTRNQRDAEQLAKDAKALAERLAKDRPAGANAAAPAAAERALQEAGERLQEAAASAAKGDVATAQPKVEAAIRALEQARAAEAQAHPNAERQAGAMAAESAATARELQNTPGAAAAEQTASEKLQAAEQAQRTAEQQLGTAHDQGRRPDASAAAAQSRQALAEAEQALAKALAASTQDRGEDLAAAANRQQQLQQAAAEARQALQQAQQNGAVQAPQAEAAQAAVKEAEQQMQAAAESLQQGRQASAGEQQRAAADRLQKAAEALQKGGKPDAGQQQQLRDQAKAQQELAEDIARLAEELKQRNNPNAQRTAEQAADAARKAKRGLEEADPESTEQEQEHARQRLEELQKQLQEEEDRYQDLRQEELLFKMKEELTQFLDKQKPITAATLEAQAVAAREALSRPARRNLNQLGEQEQELAGKIEFLVQALAEEGNLVYRAVLDANLDDLREIARRLGGRSPDPGRFTTLMQADVERRTNDLLVALENERKRREQQKKDRQQQQQQNQQSQNRFNPQREKLVGLIADLEMLKKLLQDTARATQDQQTLLEARSDAVVGEAEVALVERLANRHAEITKLFLQLKQGIEETLQAMQGDDAHESGGNGR